YHVDAFIGGLFGDELVNNAADQEGGVFSGVRVGWDFDHFWGFEGRLGFADPTVENSAQKAVVQFFDFHVLYYPWGDAKWRPFFSVGSGIARYTFSIPAVAAASEVVYHLPLGVGVKYYFHKPVALRFGLTDNLAFGSNNLSTINNFSLTGSIEWHFGGKRRTYYPYEPSLWPW
ncbi:MAG: hypothetical protein IH991_20735, partial [Planctomycetes bacterium]|nr:hypothetical protein [Planctomycetota bacterium]